MAKLFKNRTDNDIKNKWNSMQRTQKSQQAKSSISQAFGRANCNVPCGTKPQHGETKCFVSSTTSHDRNSAPSIYNRNKNNEMNTLLRACPTNVMMLDPVIADDSWDFYDLNASSV
jgi:hypothetical protein